MLQYLKTLFGISSPTPGGGAAPCALVLLVILAVPASAVYGLWQLFS